jgi:hypothetical protein
MSYPLQFTSRNGYCEAAELSRIERALQDNDYPIAAIALKLGNCTVVTTATGLAVVPWLRIKNGAAPTPSLFSFCNREFVCRTCSAARPRLLFHARTRFLAEVRV